MKLQIQKGESCTIACKITTEYEVSDLIISVGQTNFTLSSNQIELDVDTYRLKLSSEFTKTLSGAVQVIFSVKTDELGIRKTSPSDFIFTVLNNNQFSDNSKSELNSALIEITLEDGGITTNATLGQIFRGYNNYELAVQNGFTGSLQEYLASLNQLVLIDISSKGNNDVITHNVGSLMRVLTFYNDSDSGRQMMDFYASNIQANSFTLKNDFTEDKFNGQLLCIKYQ